MFQHHLKERWKFELRTGLLGCCCWEFVCPARIKNQSKFPIGQGWPLANVLCRHYPTGKPGYENERMIKRSRCSKWFARLTVAPNMRPNSPLPPSPGSPPFDYAEGKICAASPLQLFSIRLRVTPKWYKRKTSHSLGSTMPEQPYPKPYH